MSRYILKRFLGMLVVMVIVLTLVFFIIRLAPGDPAALILGPDATPADVDALRTQMGLDRPIIVQYLSFIAQVARGNLGESLYFNVPVLELIAGRAEPTFFLTLFSLMIAVSIALPIGIYAAYRRGSLFDQSAMASAIFAAAIPSFLTGLLFQQFFGTKLGWFPVSGYGTPDSSLIERLRYLILPALVLGVVNSALILRFARASMLDVMSDDYVRTARSKGMGERQVVLKHALKNALIPIVTIIGLTFALLVSGAVVTERVFNIPGLGSLVVNAVLRRDYPTIQGTLIIVAAIYVIVNFLVDMIYLAVDPRVKY